VIVIRESSGVGVRDVYENRLSKVLGPAIRRGPTSSAVDQLGDVAVGAHVGLVKVDEVILLQKLSSVGLFAIDSG
jgi:hypothetical protein